MATQIFFMFIPIWGRWCNLTNIFKMGWNHQLDDDFHPNSWRCGVVQLVQLECDSRWENAPMTMSFMMFRYFSCILGKDLTYIYIASYSTLCGSLSLGHGSTPVTSHKNSPKCIQKLQVPWIHGSGERTIYRTLSGFSMAAAAQKRW